MPRMFTAALLAGALVLPTAQVAAETLSLEQAIERAVVGAPVLRAGDAAVDAARASGVQAGVRPNPTISLSGENLAGTGRYDVLSQSELTATYSQTIERGGKREARVAYAGGDVKVAEASARVTRLDLAARVERAYFDVIIADEIAWAAEFRLKTEREMQTEAVRRVRGYKDPLFVETRAMARVTQAEINLAAAKRRQIATRNTLASYWGGDGAALETTGGVLVETSSPIVIAASDEALEEARISRARTGVDREVADGVQDYTLSGGLRYLRGTGDVAVVTGITIPLGWHDRNRGNIERARAELRQFEFEAEADRLERLRRLVELRNQADDARLSADAIRTQVIPAAVKAYHQVLAGYRRGGFTFRDLQDAADAIVDAQEQWLAAANQWRDLQTEIDRLSGRFDVSARGETEQ